MAPLGAIFLILAQAAPAPAQLSCQTGPARASVWDRARAPHLARYCDLLAQAEVRLSREPARADEAAAAAAALLPEQAAPLVLRGRAVLLLGKPAEARQHFDQALVLDPGALRHPLALLAQATALRDAGETRLALEAYRRLLPVIDAIPSHETRTRAQLDTALALAQQGPDGLDPARALLQDAGRRGDPALRAAARAALALVLDRGNAPALAAAAAAEAHQAGALAALAASPPPFGWPVEALAVQARLREVSSPAAALALWDSYLARASQGPWAAHARARAAELRKTPGKKP